MFRQKGPKPYLPVRDPAGPWSTTPNQDGSETRSEVKSHLSAQTVFAKEVGFGLPAQPRPRQVSKWKQKKQSLFGMIKAIGGFFFCGHPRLRARRSQSPESTFRRELFERSEFSRHLIRGGGGGTPLGPRTGENGFGHFCLNKSDSSRGDETPL